MRPILYTLTSSLHGEMAPDPRQEPFIRELEANGITVTTDCSAPVIDCVLIAYDGELSKQGIGLSDTVLSKLYDISTLVPAVMLAAMAVLLFVGYDLSKKKMETVRAALALQRRTEHNETA